LNAPQWSASFRSERRVASSISFCSFVAMLRSRSISSRGALFRHPQALLGPLCPFPLLREIARKPFPCLHEFAIARSQRRLDPRKGAVSTRPGSSRAATTDCCATVLCVSTSPRSFRGAETMSQLLLAPTPTVVPVGKSKGKRKTVNTVTLMTTAPHTRSGYRRSILPNFAKMLSMGI
jgi:hypothetical protein